MHVVVAGFDHFQIKSCTTRYSHHNAFSVTMLWWQRSEATALRKNCRLEYHTRKISTIPFLNYKFLSGRKSSPRLQHFVVVIGLSSIHCHLNTASIAYDSRIVTNSIFTSVKEEESQIDPIYIHNHGKIHRRRRHRRRSPL